MERNPADKALVVPVLPIPIVAVATVVAVTMVPALLLLFPAGLVVPLLFVASFPPLPGAAWELCTACAMTPQHLKAICSPIKALVVYNYATKHHRKRT